MEQGGYKHFSHAHNLIIHQMPEGIDVTCSGCNSSGNGTVYVCWQCNFFLHEQCYRAARSLKHPSHPHHPLTLLPYPTYLSNSFYCNSCEIIGTGISYSCADCEFDLHVQCAYSISRATSFHKTHHFVPSTWNGHKSNMVHNVPDSLPIPFTGAQNSYMPLNSVSSNHYHSAHYDQSYSSPSAHHNSVPAMPQNLDSLSILTSNQNPVATVQDPSLAHQTSSQNLIPNVQYPSMPQNEPSVSIPAISHIPIATSQYPSMSQTEASVSILTKYPPNPVTSSQHPSIPQDVPSISEAMNSQNPIATVQYPSIVHSDPSVSTPNNNGPNPIPRTQDPPMPHNGPSGSVPTTSHNPIPSVQYPSMTQIEPSVSVPMNSHNQVPNVQYPSMTQTGPSVSVPANPPNPIPNSQDPPIPHKGPSVSIPTSSHNQIPSDPYPSMPQTGPSVSIPTILPNPIPNNQDPPVPHTGPSVSIPTNLPNPIPNNQDPSMPQNGQSVSIPTSSQNTVVRAQFMTQPGSYVSLPTDSPNPIPNPQDLSMPQKETPVSSPPNSQNATASAQYPSMGQTGASVSIPTNPPNPISSLQDPSMPQNEKKYKEIKHFSHSHNLYVLNFQEDEENEATCSACEDTLVGKGYPCVKTDCDFLLHETCFHLKKEIQHKSHPEHPLTLLPLAPYNNKNGEFTCNACFSDGTGFTYNCSVCTFDLHIQCVSLPETVKRDDHEHVLKLFYSCPVEGEYPVCDVCHGNIQKDRWVYYCESCDYGTHLGCVDCEECEGDSNLENSILDAQAQLQRLQIQMEMSRQQAQFMATLGASLANLV